MIGIYLLKRNEEVVYVGQSINVYTRIKEHEKTKDFNSFEVLFCDRENLNSVEAFYILKYNPLLNKEKYLLSTSRVPNKKIKRVNKVKSEGNKSSIDTNYLLLNLGKHTDAELVLLLYLNMNIGSLIYDERVLKELGWSEGKLKRTKKSLKVKGDLLVVKSGFDRYDYYIGKEAVNEYNKKKESK